VLQHLSQRDGIHIPVDHSPALAAVSETQVCTARLRKARITAVKRALEDVHRAIETCYQSLEVYYEGGTNKEEAEQDKALAELQEWERVLKTDLLSALEEASRSLLKTTVRSALTRDLLERGEAALRDFLTTAMSSCDVLGFRKAILSVSRLHPEQRSSKTAIQLLNVSEIPTIQPLPILSSTSLLLYDPVSGRWSSALPLSSQLLPKGFPPVVLTESELVCIGGGYYQHPSKRSFSITLAGQVTSLPDMEVARASQGLIYADGWIYCFGGVGDNKVLRECERLACTPRGKWWEGLPDMAAARRCFSPCRWLDVVYICGGWTTASIETFHLPSLTFAPFPISLQEASEALSLVSSGELLVVTQHHFLRCSLSTLSHTTSTHYTWSGLSGSPTLQTHKIHSPSQGQILEIDLSSGHLVRISAPAD